ncbi:hypothetical protein VB734_07235 [Synechococcus sp. BA-124 BA4]|uniref:hypothetical protein n=1 Tax=unclassified Synechococcus TaxID=2626047 RepID=UPI0018CF9CCD|nr:MULTISPECIES: hypothetical protein [unclassified Synechococcus]MEA5399825.1 hypothetical protein [Synechococcus sp. BA-124 BA4]QPN56700.1 hypothetical protein I1E95_00295 [Synechococcus sp. CBW1107]
MPLHHAEHGGVADGILDPLTTFPALTSFPGLMVWGVGSSSTVTARREERTPAGHGQ